MLSVFSFPEHFSFGLSDECLLMRTRGNGAIAVKNNVSASRNESSLCSYVKNVCRDVSPVEVVEDLLMSGQSRIRSRNVTLYLLRMRIIIV